MKHITAILALIIGVQISSTAQSRIVKDFKPACDSLATLMTERTGICGNILLKTAMKRGGNLDFYFTESLGDYPWRKDDVKWFRNSLKDLFPEEYSRYRLGEIYSRKVPLSFLCEARLFLLLQTQFFPVCMQYTRKDKQAGKIISLLCISFDCSAYFYLSQIAPLCLLYCNELFFI